MEAVWRSPKGEKIVVEVLDIFQPLNIPEKRRVKNKINCNGESVFLVDKKQLTFIIK